MGDSKTEGFGGTGDGEQAAVSLIPDVDGTSIGPLLDSILSTRLEKLPSDVWVVALFSHHR